MKRGEHKWRRRGMSSWFYCQNLGCSEMWHELRKRPDSVCPKPVTPR